MRATDLQSLPREAGTIKAGAAVAPGTAVTYYQPVLTVQAFTHYVLVLFLSLPS